MSMLDANIKWISKNLEQLAKLVLRIISYKTFQTIENSDNITLGVFEVTKQMHFGHSFVDIIFLFQDILYQFINTGFARVLLEVKNNSRVKKFILSIITGHKLLKYTVEHMLNQIFCNLE